MRCANQGIRRLLARSYDQVQLNNAHQAQSLFLSVAFTKA